MTADATEWVRFAGENLQVAKLCLQSGIYNPSIHNCQQSVEKSLKAICLCVDLPNRIQVFIYSVS